MPTGAVPTAGERQDDEECDEEEGEDSEHLDPARCAFILLRHVSSSVARGDDRDKGFNQTDRLHRVVLSRIPSLRMLRMVPKLWSETIEEHRRAVREAILNTTATLVAEHGLRSVTMSQIAEETGIGRATLYKYFPDVEAILLAWHQRQIAAHFEYLAEVRDRAGDAAERLDAVLEAFALIAHESYAHHDTERAALMHRDEQVPRTERQLRDMIRDLVTEGAETGALRDDVAPDELACYCLHALTAARALPSKAAVRRLVTVTLAGLRPP